MRHPSGTGGLSRRRTRTVGYALEYDRACPGEETARRLLAGSPVVSEWHVSRGAAWWYGAPGRELREVSRRVRAALAVTGGDRS